jgi:hypothetical protein
MGESAEAGRLTVHHALGDALAVELGDLLDQVVVLCCKMIEKEALRVRKGAN